MDDLEHWNLHDQFTGHEAAALAVGLEPGRFTDEHGAPTQFYSAAYEAVSAAMSKAYTEALSTLNALETWGEGAWDLYGPDWDSADLLRSIAAQSAALCVKHARQCPPWVRIAVNEHGFARAEFSRAELARWFEARSDRFAPKYGFAVRPALESKEAASLEKPLATNERNTLLSIIGVMAVSKYRFDPAPNSRLETLGTLRMDCEKEGISISDDTLRKKLREAFSILSMKKPPM